MGLRCAVPEPDGFSAGRPLVQPADRPLRRAPTNGGQRRGGGVGIVNHGRQSRLGVVHDGLGRNRHWHGHGFVRSTVRHPRWTVWRRRGQGHHWHHADCRLRFDAVVASGGIGHRAHRLASDVRLLCTAAARRGRAAVLAGATRGRAGRTAGQIASPGEHNGGGAQPVPDADKYVRHRRDHHDRYRCTTGGGIAGVGALFADGHRPGGHARPQPGGIAGIADPGGQTSPDMDRAGLGQPGSAWCWPGC